MSKHKNEELEEVQARELQPGDLFLSNLRQKALRDVFKIWDFTQEREAARPENQNVILIITFNFGNIRINREAIVYRLKKNATS